MADGPNTNPFLDDDDISIEQRVEEPDDNTTKQSDTVDSSLDSIAARLLKENFHLTALEFYTELVESGRELPRLRDYFSNPGNFERTRDDITSPSLPRTSSIQTFDSLDFARYSDDGGGQVDERVAVLEFELRKAQETIKSLRASLTKEAENEHGSTEHLNEGNVTSTKDDQIKPLDKRALNFLINEYLLMYNYKLTSVTFSEENEDQDFEDWDDVGLNIPRPPDLLHLYKDTGNYAIPLPDKIDVACEADIEDERLQRLTNEWTVQKEQLELQIIELENQIQKFQEENEVLQKIKDEQIDISENDNILNSTTIPPNSKLNRNELDVSIMSDSSYTLVSDTAVMADKADDTNLNDDTDNLNNETVINSNHTKQSDTESCDYVVIETEDNDNRNEALSQDTENVDQQDQSDSRDLSASFRKALSDVCFHVSKDNRIVNEVSKIADSSKESVVYMLARSLPHVVPNVLLAKREELIPLILCTAMLHPEPKERDKLLNILFNLIKKPDDEQRQMILTGCIAYAQHVGHARMEEELLPQCWEQISHKYIERRVLVAEACGALASYLPREILSSLILSMLQQMLSDDKAEEVREAVVRSLGLLFGFICDKDKYSQGYELLRTALKDSSEKVVISTQQTFLPSFAAWAHELNKLEHNLIHYILKDLEELVKCAIAAQRASNCTTIPLNEGRFLILLSTLQELIPFLYISVIRSGPYVSKLPDVLHKVSSVDMSRFPKASSSLTDLKIILGDGDQLSALVYLFEEHISQEWFEPWESCNWVVNNLLSRLLEVVMGAGLSIPRVVSLLCRCFFKISRMFGKVFVEKKLRPKFIELLVLSDDHSVYQDYAAAKQTSVTTCIVPVYAAGVLAAFNTEEDRQQLTQFLQEILITLSLYQAPLDSIKMAFTELNSNSSNHELLLGVLWEGVVHTSAQVKATSARLLELMVKGVSSNLISSRVFPALVTLGSDPEITVRMATIPALGAIIENVSLVEMLDRVYMQFLTFMDDPIYRDEHYVHVEVIRTLSRVAPNAEPRFRDEFVLPRLALMAVNNNHQSNETKKREIALQLFDAYSALSCCFINDQLIQEAMLPGLRCLRQDMAHIAPEHDEVVLSIIKDYETKMDIVKHDRAGSFTQGGHNSAEDVRSRVMNRIKDTTAKANLSNIFNRKK